MEFNFGDKAHLLRGLQGPKLKIIKGKQLPNELNNKSQLCMLQLMPPSNVNLQHQEWQCFSMDTELSDPTLEEVLAQYEDLSLIHI